MTWKETEYRGWGRALRATGQLARPERTRNLAALTEDSPAPAIGNRRSYGDACLNSGGRAIDLTRMDRVLAFDEDTGLLDVEAGARIGALSELFAPRGWFPPPSGGRRSWAG